MRRLMCFSNNMHTSPGTQPLEGAGSYDQFAEHGSSPTPEQMLHARQMMDGIVDDAVYIRANAQHGDFDINGSSVFIAALDATKRGPDQPHDLKHHTTVRLALIDPTTGHVRHDMRLDEGFAGSGPTIQYFDHDYSRGDIRERPPSGLQEGHLTLQNVASGQLPEFTEIAHALRAISTQVAHERGDRAWLHDHATGLEKIAYYNRFQRGAHWAGVLASRFIKPKR